MQKHNYCWYCFLKNAFATSLAELGCWRSSHKMIIRNGCRCTQESVLHSSLLPKSCLRRLAAGAFASTSCVAGACHRRFGAGDAPSAAGADAVGVVTEAAARRVCTAMRISCASSSFAMAPQSQHTHEDVRAIHPDKCWHR